MLSSRTSSSTFNLPTLSNLAYWLLLFLPVAMIAGRSALDIAFSLLGFAFLIHTLKTNDWSLFKPAWVKLAFFIWAYLLIRSLFAMDVANNIDRGIFFGRYILGTLAIEWVFQQHQGAPKRLFQILTAIVFFVIVDIYLQYFLGQDLLGHVPINERLTGPFTDVRVGSVLLMMVFPVICWLFIYQGFKQRPLLNQLIGLGFAMLVVSAIFLTGERMVFILCLFGLVVAVFVLPNQKKIGLFLIGALTLFVLTMSVVNPNIVERQIASSQKVMAQFKDSQYGQIWRNAIKVGMQQPLVGVGPRNFRKVCPSLPQLEIHEYPIREQCNLHTHNIYLEWFAETGLIGLMLFIALVALWIKTFIQAIQRNRQDAVLIGFFVFAVVFLWPIKTSASFFTNSVALPFWFMLGWGLALTKQPLAPRP